MKLFGIENEKYIVYMLHSKQLCELPPHFIEPIRGMFKNMKDNHYVLARKIPNFIGCKTDIEISAHGYSKNISIKSGKFPSLHQEDFYSFMRFLKSLDISMETLKTVAFYHFADGTLNGTGTNKMRFDLFREAHKERIKKASIELSQERIVRAIVYRGIIKGRSETRQEIDYLYYGTQDDGFFLHKQDLLDYTWKKGYDFDTYTALHFGPIVYVAKIPTRVESDGKKKLYAQLRWPEMKKDLESIYNDVLNTKK